MKRILALMLMLALTVLCFVSCGNVSKYEDKLEDEDYEVEVIDDEDEIEEMFEMLDLDYSDYKVKEILSAYNEDGESVTIIKCGAFKAGKLVKEIEDAMEDLEDLIGDSMKVEKKGSLVFMGTKKGIKAAK